jgi:L-lactate dehydrogenase complex protein LldE
VTPEARGSVTVRERLGHQVEFPPDQTCCGQMHVNSGRYVERFAGYDAVVVPAGSCTGSVRHQHAMVAWQFYHPTCHSLRLLKVGDRPLRLLRRVAGIDLIELPDADVCCGQLVPDAHRRRAVEAECGTRTVHLAEILAGTREGG